MMLGLLGLLGCAGKRPVNLGVHNGHLMACPASPNCVASLATDDRHRITPLSFDDAPDQAFTRLKQLLRARPDATVVEEQADYIRVELRTRLFVDDAEFLLDSNNRLIHLRSASRLGYSDLGTNRRRIEDMRMQFKIAGPACM